MEPDLMPFSANPAAQGLYDPGSEHDSCGVAFVATLTGQASHDVIAKALIALGNLEHRGASGAEPDSGDGAGLLLAIPDAFFRAVSGVQLPPAGTYAAGVAFLPPTVAEADAIIREIAQIADEEGLVVLGWRDLPTDPSTLGSTARSVMPEFKQLFVSGKHSESGVALDRLAFALRKRAEHTLSVYFASLSSRTIVYKGMLTT